MNEQNSNPQPPSSPIAKQAIDQFLRDNPDWAAKPADDLTLLFESFDKKCLAVAALAGPIAEREITSGVIHSTTGRKNFLLAIHKHFLDQFHTYDKEELLFLLAWTHSRLLGAQYV